MANGADVNLGLKFKGFIRSPLDQSTDFGHDKTTDLLSKNGGKHGSNIGAVNADEYNAAQDFISAVVELNVTTHLLRIQQFIAQNQKKMAELHIENGIDINISGG